MILKIETTSEFDYFFHKFFLKTFKITKKFSLFIFSIEIESSESKKTKAISAKQFIVYSKFSNLKKSSIQISSKENSRLIVKKFRFASLTLQKFVWFFRIFFIREKTKIFLMQFFFFCKFFRFSKFKFFFNFCFFQFDSIYFFEQIFFVLHFFDNSLSSSLFFINTSK